jgi:hypothetical protein
MSFNIHLKNASQELLASNYHMVRHEGIHAYFLIVLVTSYRISIAIISYHKGFNDSLIFFFFFKKKKKAM